MATLAGPAGLLQGLVEGEQMQRRRRLQREERERQSERRKREETRQRLQLLLQALNNPAIRRRGAVSGGGAGGGRGGRGRPSGAAGLPTVGRGPSEPTGQGPMTAAAPLLGLADRTRRGEAPGQENQPTGSVLSAATGGGGIRDREARGGRRVRGLGPLNELLGRSGEDALVFDPSRTESARRRRAADEKARETARRKASMVNEIMRLAPEEFDRDSLMDLTEDQAWSLLKDVQQQHFEEEQTARERRMRRRRNEQDEARKNRIDRAKDAIFNAAMQGDSFTEAMDGLNDQVAGAIDQREARIAFQNGRDMLEQRSEDKARQLISQKGGGDEAVREVWRSLQALENPTIAEQKLLSAVRDIGEEEGVQPPIPVAEESGEGEEDSDIPFVPGI